MSAAGLNKVTAMTARYSCSSLYLSCVRRTSVILHTEWAKKVSCRIASCKSKEIIFCAREKRGQSTQLPSPCMNIERASSMKVLDVIINDQMTATDHVHTLQSYDVRFPCATQSRHPSCVSARRIHSDYPYRDYEVLASMGR